MYLVFGFNVIHLRYVEWGLNFLCIVKSMNLNQGWYLLMTTLSH